jgi:hypothetical protein
VLLEMSSEVSGQEPWSVGQVPFAGGCSGTRAALHYRDPLVGEFGSLRLPQHGSAGGRRASRSAAGDEGYDYVGGVAVQVLAAMVIHGGGPWVGMSCRELDLP